MLYESISQNYIFITIFVLIIVIADIVIMLYLINRIKNNKHLFSKQTNSDVIEQIFYNSAAPLLVFRAMPDGSLPVINFNHSAFRLLGESPVDKSVDNYFEMADPNILIMDYLATLDLTQNRKFLVALKSGEKRKFDFEFEIHAIDNSDLAVAFLRNVRDERDIINKYKDSQYALNLAMENVRIAIWEFDVAAQKFYCENLWFKLHGLDYIAEGILFDDFVRIVKDTDVDLLIKNKEDLISGEITDFIVEYKVFSGGHWEWRRTTAKAKFRDINGKATVLIGVSLDINSEKKLSKRITYLSRNFQLLMENSPDYIYFKDKNYKFTMVSKSLDNELKVSGHSSIVGLSDFDIYPFEDANNLFDLEKRVMEKGECIVNYEQSFKTVTGRLVWTLATKIPVRNKEGETIGIIGISKDITEYKQLSIELSNNQRLRSVSRLAGGIAHDFNNSLNGIMGFAYLLESMVDKDSKENEYIQHIVKSTEKCAELTRHLLAFARRGKYEVKVIDLHDVIKHAVQILEHSISTHVKVDLQLEAENPVIKADESQIENVVINIANNADSAMDGEGTLIIKTSNSNFIKKDSFKASSSTRFRRKDIGNCVVIEFTDTGSGIEKDVIERIFEPFFTTKPLGKGTGLGLAAVYGIVENHGGMVGVESTVGVGTTVQVYLPVAEKSSEKKLIPPADI